MSPRFADAAVWVLDDQRSGVANQAIGIVERLGVTFRRVPLSWNWLAGAGGVTVKGSLLADERGGSSTIWVSAGHPNEHARHPAIRPAPGPALLVSSGNRSAAAALWLKARLGCPVVQVMRPQLPLKLVGPLFDAMVIPRHDLPPRMPNVLPVLGMPHRVSPLALAQARATWRERLDHLPRPRIALLVGGSGRGTELAPSLAHALGLQLARMAQAVGGCVLATTTPRTGVEAEDALSAGLGSVLHVLYRSRDPGANPYVGFLATADMVVVTAGSASMISEACATDVPLFIALPGLAAPRQKHFLESLYLEGEARPLGDTFETWPRRALDEAGRIAGEITRQFPLE